MRTLGSVVVVSLSLCVGCSTPTVATVEQAPPPAPAVAANPIPGLAPFAPLVGGTWSAAFNEKIRDESRFTWVFDGKFLRNEHWVKDETDKVVYAGETLYAIDPKSDTLLWWYWNTTGGYITGDGTWTETTGDFEGENHAGAEQTARVRSRLELGADSFTATGWFWKDGAWVEQGKRTYRRMP